MSLATTRKVQFLTTFTICILLTAITALSQPKSSDVPRVIRYNGTLKNVDGTPRTGTVGMSFSIYADDQGTVPLWQEVQNVRVDEAGNYSVLLGATRSDGLPIELFKNNDARWLGVRVENEREQARSSLVAVPYAVKAADAETLGGKPLSAFVLNETLNASGSNNPGGSNDSVANGGSTHGQILRAPSVSNGLLTARSAVITGGVDEYSLTVQSGNTWIGPGSSNVSPEAQTSVQPPSLVRNTVVATIAPGDQVVGNQRGTDFGTSTALADGTTFGNYDWAAMTVGADSPAAQIIGTAHQLYTNLNGHSMSILNVDDAYAVVDGTGGKVVNAVVDFHASGATVAPGNNVNYFTGFYAEPFNVAGRNIGFYTDGAYSDTDRTQWGSILHGRNWFGVNPAFFTPQASYALYRDDAIHSGLVGRGTVTGTPGVQVAADIPAAAGFGAGQSGVYTATTFALSGDAPAGQLAGSLTRTSVNPAGYHMNRLAAQNAYVEAAAPGATASGSVDWVALYDTTPTSLGNTTVTNQADFYASRNANAATNYGFFAEDFGNGYAFYGSGGRSYFGGKVGIGKTSPADQLDVAGEVRVNSCVKNAGGSVIAGTCSSDVRLKKNIVPFPRMLDKVAMLRPVTFDWRVDEFPEYHFGREHSYGLVAQEVSKILPELVGKDEHGMNAVNYSELPLMILEAVRELKDESDSLRHEVEVLRAEVHTSGDKPRRKRQVRRSHSR